MTFSGHVPDPKPSGGGQGPGKSDQRKMSGSKIYG